MLLGLRNTQSVWKEHRPMGWHRRDSCHPLRQMWSQGAVWTSEGHGVSKGDRFSTKGPWFLRTVQVTPGFVARVNPTSWIWTHWRSSNSPFKAAIYVSKKKKKKGNLEDHGFQSNHSEKYIYTLQPVFIIKNILSMCSFSKGLIIQKTNSKPF